jgi:hypothetical protein
LPGPVGSQPIGGILAKFKIRNYITGNPDNSVGKSFLHSGVEAIPDQSDFVPTALQALAQKN